MQEIPLTAEPEQVFSIALNGTVYEIRVIYNTRCAIWSLSLYILGDPVLQGIPFMPGVNLLDHYALDIANLFILNTIDAEAAPTLDNLGTIVKLLVLTDEEVASGTAI